jgi:hypothetical protein
MHETGSRVVRRAGSVWVNENYTIANAASCHSIEVCQEIFKKLNNKSAAQKRSQSRSTLELTRFTI